MGEDPHISHHPNIPFYEVFLYKIPRNTLIWPVYGPAWHYGVWVTWNAAKGDAEAGHVPDVHRGLWRIGCAVVFVSTIAPSVRCGDLQEGGGALVPRRK